LAATETPFLAQDHHRLLHIALGFGQGLFAIHHRSSGFSRRSFTCVAEMFTVVVLMIENPFFVRSIWALAVGN
jgi:hypothetical protein